MQQPRSHSQSVRTRSSQEARAISQSQLAAAMPTVAEQPQPITFCRWELPGSASPNVPAWFSSRLTPQPATAQGRGPWRRKAAPADQRLKTRCSQQPPSLSQSKPTDSFTASGNGILNKTMTSADPQPQVTTTRGHGACSCLAASANPNRRHDSSTASQAQPIRTKGMTRG